MEILASRLAVPPVTDGCICRIDLAAGNKASNKLDLGN
jgi:hypothetical protein